VQNKLSIFNTEQHVASNDNNFVLFKMGLVGLLKLVKIDWWQQIVGSIKEFS